MFEAETIISHSKDSVTWLFIAIGILLFILNIFYKSRLRVTNTSFLSEKYIGLFYSTDKNKSIFARFDAFLFFLVNILTTTLLIKTIDPQNGYALIISLFLGVFLILDYGVKYGLSTFFEYQEEQRHVTYLKNTYLNNITLWILPFLLFYHYSPISKDLFKWISISLLLILLTLRYLFVISKYKKPIKHHLFYFILYICTLEIAPILIFAKWVTKM